ncbi:MAG: response regulator [Bdellovibrionales bacterium]|nr:response regulator [Bdellovibrionales bacterium]
MVRNKKTVPILVADDDLDDCQMIREALQESRLINEVHFVHDGEQLLSFLEKSHKETLPEKNLLPGLILLDLNMPRMDGREVLKKIKDSADLHLIPIIVLTTSKAEEDILRSYNLGANSFITKPLEFDALVQVMKDVGKYWFELVELPDLQKRGR